MSARIHDPGGHPSLSRGAGGGVAVFGMLRNVLIISDAGLVLFSKEFVSAVAQPRLVGSLLTAMLEFSSNNVGAPVCYIEMSNVAVSICASHPPDESGIFALSGASVSSAGHSQLSFNPVAGSSPDKPPPFAKNRSESHHSSTSTTPQVCPEPQLPDS